MTKHNLTNKIKFKESLNLITGPKREVTMPEEIISNPTLQTQPQFRTAETTQHREIKFLSQTNMRRIQELQTANDELHRQIVQLEKDMNHSADALSLVAERERCHILIARNSGEIAKIHTENEERIRRIGELEGKNKRLVVEKATHRENFMDIRDPHERVKQASNYLLTQSHLQKNADEIFELNQE